MPAYEVLDGDVVRDRETVIALGCRNLPQFSAQRFATYYERGPGSEPLFQIALDAARDAVGMAALFPTPVWIDGRLHDGAVAGDFAVDAAHRAFGPALRLQRRLLERAGARGIAIAYGIPNRAAEPLLQRVGYTPLGAMDSFVKPLRIAAVLRRYARDPRAARMAIHLRSQALTALRPQRRRRRRESEVERFHGFDERFARLLESAGTRARVMPERTIDSLNRKFSLGREAGPSAYTVDVLRDGVDVSAYAVVARDDRVHRVVDLVYGDEDDLDALLHGVVRGAHAGRAIAVTVRSFGAGNALLDVLDRLGFVREQPSVALNVVVPPGATPSEVALRPEHWQLWPGDLDI
jgi:GNAT superfamily N-acetyltransferase